MAYAFKTLRPLFRERGKINAEVTGRLTEVAGRHPRGQVLHRGEARGDCVRQGRPPAVPQHRQVDDRRLGHHRWQHGDRRHRRRPDDRPGRPGHPGGADDAGRPGHVHLLHRAGGGAAGLDCVHRHADHRGVRRARPHPRTAEHGHRGRRGRAAGQREPADGATSPSSTCGSSTRPAGPCCATCRSPRRPARPRRSSGRAGRARARSSAW